MTDEDHIRELIQRWAAAVHTGDMATVLADHAPDIVMFDVPPPYEGLRGIDAYRDTWPGFFRWQASGASFELESLDVTAGTRRRVRLRTTTLRHASGLRPRPGPAATAHHRAPQDR